MSLNFKKLKIKHDITGDHTDKVLGEVFETGEDGKFYNIRHCSVKKELSEKLLSYIPEQYRDQFGTSSLTLKTDIFKHTDPGNYTNINFYVNAGKSITSFYELDTSGRIIPCGEDGLRFLDELKFIESFVADEGDVYIFKSSQPHSVQLVETDNRMVYNAITKIPFDEVCEMLRHYWE